MQHIFSRNVNVLLCTTIILRKDKCLPSSSFCWEFKINSVACISRVSLIFSSLIFSMFSRLFLSLLSFSSSDCWSKHACSVLSISSESVWLSAWIKSFSGIHDFFTTIELSRCNACVLFTRVSFKSCSSACLLFTCLYITCVSSACSLIERVSSVTIVTFTCASSRVLIVWLTHVKYPLSASSSLSRSAYFFDDSVTFNHGKM